MFDWESNLTNPACLRIRNHDTSARIAEAHPGPQTMPGVRSREILCVAEVVDVCPGPSRSRGALALRKTLEAISRNTSATGTELRLARHRQLDLGSYPPIFEVTGDTTKNTIRPRRIPLNDDGGCGISPSDLPGGADGFA